MEENSLCTNDPQTQRLSGETHFGDENGQANPERNETDNAAAVAAGTNVNESLPCNSSNSSDITEKSAHKGTDLNLTELPSEILLHITSFLDAKFVIETLTNVCRLFHSLMSDSTFWKVRLKKRFPKKYPAIPVNDMTYDWREACILREERYHQWSAAEQTMDFFLYSEYYAAVDAVHLMNHGSVLATGSRDRYLHLLNVDKLDADDPESINHAKLHVAMDAHAGWVWTIDSVDHTLVTGSWDTNVKFWDLQANCTFIDRVKLKSAALCMHFEQNFLAVGCYDKKVYHIDPRQSGIIAQHRRHKQPVLCMVADDKYIITGSEDKTVKVYDRRADSIFKTIQLESFPMSASYAEDQLWIGDKAGCLSLIDATDGDFNVVETYDIGSKGKLTGVIYDKGALFTASTDGALRVLEPTLDPDVLTTLRKNCMEVTSICLQNDILVQGNSGASVGIWKPKDWNRWDV